MFFFRKSQKKKQEAKQREELGLTQKEYRDLKNAFALFDKDNNGYIEAHELECALKALGENPTPEMVANMIQSADTVCMDGRVEFTEFCHLMKQFGQGDREEECRQLFKVIDKDVSGFINRGELTHALTQGGYFMTEEEINATFQHADQDRDGLISFQEFVNLMKTNPNTSHPNSPAPPSSASASRPPTF